MVFFLSWIVGIVTVIVGKSKLGPSTILTREWSPEYAVNITTYFIPIFLYGCEVWGLQRTKLIEKFHLKFCKHILYFNSSTPNFMMYGES